MSTTPGRSLPIAFLKLGRPLARDLHHCSFTEVRSIAPASDPPRETALRLTESGGISYEDQAGALASGSIRIFESVRFALSTLRTLEQKTSFKKPLPDRGMLALSDRSL
jgi:hypothetical protein